jgi:hypothetical protein
MALYFIRSLSIRSLAENKFEDFNVEWDDELEKFRVWQIEKESGLKNEVLQGEMDESPQSEHLFIVGLSDGRTMEYRHTSEFPYAIFMDYRAGDNMALIANGTDATVVGGKGRIDANVTGSNSPFYLSLNGSQTPVVAQSGERVSWDVFASSTPYEIKATDAAGFIEIANVLISEPVDDLNGNAVPTDVTKIGGADGKITINMTGSGSPFKVTKRKSGTSTYSLVGSGESPYIITGLTAGSYDVRVTDTKGNIEAFNDITIKEPVCVLTLSATTAQASPNGSATGKIAVLTNSSGNTTPTQFKLMKGEKLISGYSTTSTFTGLVAGSDYVVWAIDHVGCEKSLPVTLTEAAKELPCTLVVNGSVTQHETTYNAKNGVITVSATKNQGAVQFKIMQGTTQVSGYSSTSTFTGLADGTYTVYGKDTVCEVSKSNLTVIGAAPVVEPVDTSDKGKSNLWFGEEQVLIGNVSTKAEAIVQRTKFVTQLNINQFFISTNPTWTEGKPVYITEVGIYDAENNLVAIGKLNSPVPKTGDGIVVLVVDMDF